MTLAPGKGPAANYMGKTYNPATFDLRPPGARFFVIKSSQEDDVHKSVKYKVWASTKRGNHTLVC